MTRRTPHFRKGGRPRKPDPQKRRLRIAARVRPDELATIEGRAAENNISLSDFLREQALSGAILVRKSRRLSAIDRHDLARIGSNLNQIARACNASGDSFRARAIEAILEELRNLLRRIDAAGQASDELGEG
jgi:uncharacterized protein (DUF1778 family)